MAGRRTNLALLVALVVAMGTGIAAFAVGTDSGRPIIVAHGIAGLAVVLLTPWKQQIVRRGLRRRRSGRAGVVLGVLILLTLGTGVAHAP
jgi:predicted PurR-regulated permease PerM